MNKSPGAFPTEYQPKWSWFEYARWVLVAFTVVGLGAAANAKSVESFRPVVVVAVLALLALQMISMFFWGAHQAKLYVLVWVRLFLWVPAAQNELIIRAALGPDVDLGPLKGARARFGRATVVKSADGRRVIDPGDRVKIGTRLYIRPKPASTAASVGSVPVAA